MLQNLFFVYKVVCLPGLFFFLCEQSLNKLVSAPERVPALFRVAVTHSGHRCGINSGAQVTQMGGKCAAKEMFWLEGNCSCREIFWGEESIPEGKYYGRKVFKLEILLLADS